MIDARRIDGKLVQSLVLLGSIAGVPSPIGSSQKDDRLFARATRDPCVLKINGLSPMSSALLIREHQSLMIGPTSNFLKKVRAKKIYPFTPTVSSHSPVAQLAITNSVPRLLIDDAKEWWKVREKRISFPIELIQKKGKKEKKLLFELWTLKFSVWNRVSWCL